MPYCVSSNLLRPRRYNLLKEVLLRPMPPRSLWFEKAQL